MTTAFPPQVGERFAGRFELRARVRGSGPVWVFLVRDHQTGGDALLGLVDPARSDAAAWAELTRIVAAAGSVPALERPLVIDDTTSPPHWLLPVHASVDLDGLRASSGPLPWPQALALGERIAGALQAAFTATQVAHRALLPSRCLVVGDEIHLLDVGVAAFEPETGRPDDTGYRAPEQERGRGDNSSDVYTLAAILFELISGKRPSPKMPPRLRSLLPGIPPAVDQLLATALARDPTRRHADADALRTALRQLLELPPISASPPPAPASEPPPPAPASEPSPTTESPALTTSPADKPQLQSTADDPPLRSPADEPSLRSPALPISSSPATPYVLPTSSRFERDPPTEVMRAPLRTSRPTTEALPVVPRASVFGDGPALAVERGPKPRPRQSAAHLESNAVVRPPRPGPRRASDFAETSERTEVTRPPLPAPARASPAPAPTERLDAGPMRRAAEERTEVSVALVRRPAAPADPGPIATPADEPLVDNPTPAPADHERPAPTAGILHERRHIVLLGAIAALIVLCLAILWR